jgi:multiple sugar transport system ATP-binding protein
MSDVALRSVVKSYGANEVIHGLDLDIKSGEFVVFVGPSGCGKSTLLRMIAGLEDITDGQIAIGGTVVNELPPRARDIAMVFQDYALYPHKSVFENMAFGLRLRKRPEQEIRTRVGEAAAILQIEHLYERKPRELSGGQRQRVAMGRAIVRQPKAFLFDEPLSNLDALLRAEMRVEIKKLHQKLGNTIIYVTHDQVEAMTLADRIVVLQAGNLIQYDTPDGIYNRPAAQFVAGFTGAPPMNFLPCRIGDGGRLLHLPGGIDLRVPARRVAETAKHVGREVVFGLRPEHITVGSAGDATRA